MTVAAQRQSRRTDAPPTELALLRAHLFAPPDALASAARPRSAGPDGSVHLEEHAGVDAELEATAAWVSRQVLDRGLPLEEIAVLVPAQDPLAQLVAERLARLPYEGGPLPVHVAGGVPATSSAAGARVLTVLRALEAHLAADALAQVLPALRLAAPEGARQHLTQGEAMELAYALGTVGGSAACPADALTWSPRAAARTAELEVALAGAERGEDAREARRLARMLANLRAVRPALDALVGVARALVEGASLAALCDVLFPFLHAHLLAPGEGGEVAPRLAEALAPARAGAPGAALAGGDALALVKAYLLALRAVRGRFGDPAVYVGTVAGAAGLTFAAVRVVGLCEGVLPSAPREDPVVPEALRASIEAAVPGRVVRSAADRAAAQVHTLAAAVDGAGDAVVLSAPRVDLARTEREPAALFVDAAAALGRPDAATGARATGVPGAQALRRDAFLPARAAAAAYRAARPVSEADWLDRAARVEAASPPWWAASEVVALGRIAALRAPAGEAGAADGVLGGDDPFPSVPGVDPARPISASALGALLSCPRMFLMQRILGWDEPASAPALRELDALSFGTLVHRVHETLYRAHGADIDARARTLAHWQGVAAKVADRAFAEVLAEVPLLGAEVRRKERARLGEAVRTFLEHDWSSAGTRRFVGVEVAFGYDAPLTVGAGGVALHVGGYIDRVDVEGDATLVRDLKTGRVHARSGDEAGPTAGRDVQLGLYQLAARRLAGRWGAPERVVAAYVYANGRGDVEERAFRADAGALASATEQWLATAAALLHGRAFVSTPHAEDCTHCPFEPVCGAEAPRRAAACLAEAEGGPLARFRALKDGEEEDG
ncbi:MAG: PD-(D/E)XK nuclease family protein [Anaeromyxobacteraceae bacterium]